jgi:hypothetical protein
MGGGGTSCTPLNDFENLDLKNRPTPKFSHNPKYPPEKKFENDCSSMPVLETLEPIDLWVWVLVHPKNVFCNISQNCIIHILTSSIFAQFQVRKTFQSKKELQAD